MTEMAVSEAREHLAEVIDSAQRTGEPVFVLIDARDDNKPSASKA